MVLVYAEPVAVTTVDKDMFQYPLVAGWWSSEHGRSGKLTEVVVAGEECRRMNDDEKPVAVVIEDREEFQP
jgi:hypothetical protein